MDVGTEQRSGTFEPYAVGDPGSAAVLVEPAADGENRYHPDTVVDGVVVAGPDGRRAVQLRAASLRGLSHQYYGRARQDEYGFRTTPDGRFLLACVSDGVSSGPWSHFAAGWVARDGLDLLADRLATAEPEELDWHAFIADVCALITERVPAAADVEQLAGWMSATALYVVLDLARGPVLPVTVFSVGDSSAWILRDGVWHPQHAVKGAGEEYFSPAVVALPLVPAEVPPAVRAEIAPGDALVLMSDGIGDALGDGTGEVGDFLAGHWRSAPAPLGFAAQAAFHRKSYDDDRTALAVWPLGGV